MIVVDSGSIISLAMNCLCPVLGMMGRKFVITPKVYHEIIERPSESRRFALESLRIAMLVANGVVQVRQPTNRLAERILDIANQTYEIRGRPMTIIHHAEAEVIGLAQEIGAAAIMMDERTTRLLMEDPMDLRELLSHRNAADVRVNKKRLDALRDVLPKIPVIRSAEIIAVAYEKGFLTQLYGIDDKKVLDSALSALKYSGCAITWEEIDEYLREEI